MEKVSQLLEQTLPKRLYLRRSTSLVAPTCKLLVNRAQKEDGVNGITENSFTKYLFPLYPELGSRLFRWLQAAGGGTRGSTHVSGSCFRTQCEKILALIDDAEIIHTFVQIFSSSEEAGSVGRADLRALLYTSYQLSMDHYPDGPRTCLSIQQTLGAVVEGCFDKKESHSAGFVERWLQVHCRRGLSPVHRYCVHVLGTRHRDLQALGERPPPRQGDTPVLDRAPCQRGGLLPLSAAWLLAATAAPLYTAAPPPPACPRAWLSRLVCLAPSHWLPIYESQEHGLGLNRFLHHTLSYRGPTVVLLAAEELVVALCCSSEWRDSHQYWGAEGCALVQLRPAHRLLEEGPRMVYLNSSARGYPKGLRAGSDPRKPLLSVNEDFDTLTVSTVPYPLRALEVWGCGDTSSREKQLEIKKWQVKEAEKQGQVKLSAAEWREHPDRYLLELAGRPQYNNTDK